LAAQEKARASAIKSVKDLASAINGLLKPIEKVGTYITATITGLVALGAKGTYEAMQLKQAFMLFARSVADAFAPVIRGLTAFFQKLSTWFSGLSRESKWAVVGITAITMATVALAGAMALLAGTIAAVTVAFITNPIGAIITGIVVAITAALVAIPAAFATFMVATKGWEDGLKDILALALDLWKWFVEIGKAISKWTVPPALSRALQAIGYLVSPSAESRKTVDSMFGGPSKVTPYGKTRFESLQGTFDRITENIKPQPSIEQKKVDLLSKIEQNTRSKEQQKKIDSALWWANLGVKAVSLVY
jgi:hypothetical protein